MKYTYNEILTNMKNAYSNECGERLVSESPVHKRLEAVASELYALSCYGDYIFKQAFVQSATGEQLEKHAAMRGVTRKSASYSSGELTFYSGESASEDIFIPSGTICSVYKKPYLQYATDTDAVIEAGSMSATVTATSIEKGEEYNVGEGEICVMVNAPVGVTGVINADGFIGGADSESDLSLRNRVINHYNIKPNGFNNRSIENVILNLDFMVDCYITGTDNLGEILIVVKTKDGTLPFSQELEVRCCVGIAKVVNAYITVLIAQPKDFDIVCEVNIRSGFDTEQVKGELRDAVKELCSALKIGEALELNSVSRAILNIEGISDFNVYSPDSVGEIVGCGSVECLHLREVVVNCFDK